MQGPEGVEPLLKGGCFCGTVTLSIFAPPVLSVYCHCTSCQRLTGAPFVHMMHFKEKDFAWSWPLGQAAAQVINYYDNPLEKGKRRFRCKQCGAPVATFDAAAGRYIAYGASLERGLDGEILGWEQVKPTAHQNYGTRVMDVSDELAKWE